MSQSAHDEAKLASQLYAAGSKVELEQNALLYEQSAQDLLHMVQQYHEQIKLGLANSEDPRANPLLTDPSALPRFLHATQRVSATAKALENSIATHTASHGQGQGRFKRRDSGDSAATNSTGKTAAKPPPT